MYVVNKAIFMGKRTRKKRGRKIWEKFSELTVWEALGLFGRAAHHDRRVWDEATHLWHLREGGKKEEEGGGFSHNDEKTSHLASSWKVSGQPPSLQGQTLNTWTPGQMVQIQAVAPFRRKDSGLPLLWGLSFNNWLSQKKSSKWT